MVESRIRHLVLDLENTDNIIIAHPSTTTINNSFICLTDEEQAGASQGELSMDAMQRKDEDFKDRDHKRVYTKNFFIGLEIEKKPSETIADDLEAVANRIRGWFRQPHIESVLPQQAILWWMSAVGSIR
jgi:poly(A) polymerase Pap1